MLDTFHVQSGAARIAGEAAGRGAPIVFLHAGVADRRMWRTELHALGDTHRAIAYDRRGFGDTAYDPEPHAPARDLLAVLDHHGARDAILVGCSQGGRIAIDAALAHPDRVRALVLVAPAASGAPDPGPFPEPIQRLSDQLDAAEKAGDLERVNALEAHLWLDGPLAAEGRVSGEARALFLDMNGRALRAPGRGEEIAAPPAWPRLSEIRVPALVVYGTLDFPHLQERCEQLVRVLPDARLHRMEGVAHLPNLEQPVAFGAALQAFLARVER